MQIFGLVIASKREFETVFERIDKNSYKEIEKSPFKVFEVKIGNKKVYTILSGVGEILAAAATQHLIDKYNVTFIFNYGVVGSLVDEIDLNNTVIVEKIVDYEFDTTPIDDSKVGEHLGLINDQYLRVNSEILSLILLDCMDKYLSLSNPILYILYPLSLCSKRKKTGVQNTCLYLPIIKYGEELFNRLIKKILIFCKANTVRPYNIYIILFYL